MKTGIEEHIVILKANEDLKKAFAKTLVAVRDLNLAPGLDNEVMQGLQDIERVARYLHRKAKVIARTQP